MRRLTRAERAAAMAVLGMAAATTAAGVKLLARHTRILAEKAAAHFQDEDEELAEGISAENVEKEVDTQGDL